MNHELLNNPDFKEAAIAAIKYFRHSASFDEHRVVDDFIASHQPKKKWKVMTSYHPQCIGNTIHPSKLKLNIK